MRLDWGDCGGLRFVALSWRRGGPRPIAGASAGRTLMVLAVIAFGATGLVIFSMFMQ